METDTARGPKSINLIKKESVDRIHFGSAVTLARDMSKMVNRKLFSDINFIVGVERERMFAHKCILAARSDTFRQLFSNEPTKAVFELDRVKPLTFLLLLYFLYTNSVSFDRLDIDEVFDLMLLSEEYRCTELSDLAQQQISYMLDVRNVFQYLTLAISGKRARLRNAALECIEDNSSTLLVPTNADLLSLSPEAMKSILFSDLLDVEENRLIEVACYWAEHYLQQAHNKSSNIQRLISKASIITFDDPISAADCNQGSSEGSLDNKHLSKSPVVGLTDVYDKISAHAVEKQAYQEVGEVMTGLRLALLPAHELAQLEEDQLAKQFITKECFVDAWRLIVLQTTQPTSIDSSVNRTIGTARKGTSRGLNKRRSIMDANYMHQKSKFRNPDLSSLVTTSQAPATLTLLR